MNTITTNKTAAEIRNALKYQVEGLPEGLTLETLKDIYRCFALDALKNALKTTTPEGRQLKRQIQPAISKIATVEQINAAADLIFDLADKYTNVNDVSTVFANLDTVLPGYRSAFVADFTKAVQA